MVLRTLVLGLSFVSAMALAQSHHYSEIDLQKLEKDLTTTGIQGWIHGAVEAKDMYVFTYRNPTDFFDYITFPVTSADRAVLQSLQAMNRHDQVLVVGTFVDNHAPIQHIDISKLTMVKPYTSEVTESYYFYKGRLEDVINSEEMVARVHAIGGDGQILVVEYKDLVIPVFVKDPDDLKLVQTLYRGDKIRLRYKVQKNPHSPTHLNPKSKADLNGAPAIEILLSLVQTNGQEVKKTGSLVFFPKSPEINRNIFALQEADSDEEPIQYTLVNFEDSAIFEAIQNKLQKVWDEQKASAVNGRNKMINLHIHLVAHGTMNMVSQSQANPQILLNSADDIEVSVETPAPAEKFVENSHGGSFFRFTKI